MNFSGADIVVVGAGLYGLTAAERCAALGKRVLVLERRDHVGGNAHSRLDPDTGIEVHTYGSHLFHCNSLEVWDYLSEFSAFTNYRHRVLTVHNGRVYSMPINLGTLCSFFNRHLTPGQARRLIEEDTDVEGGSSPSSLEDKAVSLIGRPLYEALIRGYTAKQWQTDPRLLSPDIITRLPVRYNFNADYFDDRFQGLPADGYASLFTRMIVHPRIDVELGVDFFEVRDNFPAGVPVIYTGPLDRYFNYRLGPLSWRTLDFQRELHAVGDYQGTAVMNYADEAVPYTRVHEFRHLHPERRYPADRTVIFREYSRFAGRQDEPYYPVNALDDRRRYDAYRELAALEPNVIFGGRLGTYRYLDMHQAVGAALKLVNNVLAPHFRDGRPLKTTADSG